MFTFTVNCYANVYTYSHTLCNVFPNLGKGRGVKVLIVLFSYINVLLICLSDYIRFVCLTQHLLYK